MQGPLGARRHHRQDNLEQMPRDVRQIRLRDLGGIIIIDSSNGRAQKIATASIGALEERVEENESRPSKIIVQTDFGLVRNHPQKRVKQSPSAPSRPQQI